MVKLMVINYSRLKTTREKSLQTATTKKMPRLQVGSILLPQVDNICGLVEQNNGAFAGDPALAVELGFELFPSVLAGPKEVRAERDGSVARHNLVNGNTDVLLQPQKS